MSTKHTPGPWATDEADHDEPFQSIRIKAQFRTVCTVWIDDAPVPDFNAEQEANARLIAAAPDLLEALQRMRRWAEGDSVNYTGDHPVAIARAAIAKAVGERK